MDTVGLYIQIPFCASECSFCNFSSQVAPERSLERYCDALEKEIRGLADQRHARAVCTDWPDLSRLLTLPVDTVYLGGGTPTLLGRERLTRIIQGLRRTLRLTQPIEFTIEAAPGSAGPDVLDRLRAVGANRLSIGAQSFVDRELRCLGRLHTSTDTAELVNTARRAGFENVSLDLIAGLPYQTARSWQHSLDEAVRLAPEHLSIYLFEIDEKSRLGNEVLQHGTRYHASAVPGDDFMADAYEVARNFLPGQGYEQYEISNFALPGYESRHNQKYWTLHPYLGLGAGAHSFDGKHRWCNVEAVDVYESRLTKDESPIAEMHSLSTDQQLEEFFFLGLRQRTGVELNVARRSWGPQAVSRWEPKIAALARQGWLEKWNERIRIPQHAFLISNEIFEQFLI